MVKEDLETWTQRIAWTALVAIVIGGISWAAWATVEIHNKVEYVDLEDHSPYSQDKIWIAAELSTLKVTCQHLQLKLDGEFSKTIKANTEAIIQLKEQMRYNQQMWDRMLQQLEKHE